MAGRPATFRSRMRMLAMPSLLSAPAILLTLPIFVPLAMPAAETHDGGLQDGNLRFIGRWDHADPGVAHSYWSTAYLRTSFTGTTLRVRLAGWVELEAFIDGQAVKPVPFPGGVDLAPLPLAAGAHTLVLATAGQNHEMLFQGLELAPGASTAASPERPLLEFVGDSITANGGRVAAAKDSAGGPATSNYSWLAAEALGCDHVQVAFSGVALATGSGFFGDRTGFDTWYFKLKNCNHATDNAPWTFAYAPRLVVVNLGTNDVKGGKRPSDDEFAATYAAFLRAIRARLPHSTLVGVRPFGGFQGGGVAKAVAALTAAGDPAVRFVDTSGWLAAEDYSDGIHPTVPGHAKAAARLTAALRAVLAEPAAP